MKKVPQDPSGEFPIDFALCAFKTKKGGFFLGYVEFAIEVTPYGTSGFISIYDLESYQYILDEKNEVVFIDPKDHLKTVQIQPKHDFSYLRAKSN